ncbi:MAG: ABC transporter permease [Pseudomonadota bacterium]|nr:ABC transporter permease [Pseudomonadota bacterium]
MFENVIKAPLLTRRFSLELRQEMAWYWQAMIITASLAAGVVISVLILMAAGVPAGELVNEFIVYTLLDAESLKSVLYQASPLIMVGLAGSLAFRARFWNLGLEGQMIFGAIAATGVAIFDIGPTSMRLVSMLIAGMLGGLAWAILPVALKIRWQVNEIVSTLMLNYIAANFLFHLLYGSWKDPKSAFPYSPQYETFERLPDIMSGISLSVPLALVISLIVLWYTVISRSSLYLKFVDKSPSVAIATGIPFTRVILFTVLMSGALAGLAGVMITAGQEGRLTHSFYNGYGFSGILIAFLARNNPLAAIATALLIALLFIAGQSLQVFYQIPFAMVQLIQAILVICVASSDFFIRHRIRRIASGAE